MLLDFLNEFSSVTAALLDVENFFNIKKCSSNRTSMAWPMYGHELVYLFRWQNWHKLTSQ